jgi:hypothetical protein
MVHDGAAARGFLNATTLIYALYIEVVAIQKLTVYTIYPSTVIILLMDQSHKNITSKSTQLPSWGTDRSAEEKKDKSNNEMTLGHSLEEG